MAFRTATAAVRRQAPRRLPPSASLRPAPAAAGAALQGQRRWGDIQHVEITELNRKDYIMYNGKIYVLYQRTTQRTGRGAATGHVVLHGFEPAVRGDVQTLSGWKWNKVNLDREKIAYSHVDEDDMLVFDIMQDDAEKRELVPSGRVLKMDAEEFCQAVPGGAGGKNQAPIVRWIMDDMQMTVYSFDDRVIEVKIPPTYTYQIRNVGQVAGKTMIVLAENEVQIEVDTPHVRPGMRVKVALPEGRVVKLER
eukprot:TRINITY_DN17470_c0_g5_i1.p1 TRINITY_DN17470_c0_g5~~TRINITY_DN17470_c0_g5_i1.p1  ORF type:complete len:251 (+),score=54.09 TRINITY_DN17470_c0_g5_i1:97-849(+)